MELLQPAEPPEAAEAAQPAEPAEAAEVADSVLVAVEEDSAEPGNICGLGRNSLYFGFASKSIRPYTIYPKMAI